MYLPCDSKGHVPSEACFLRPSEAPPQSLSLHNKIRSMCLPSNPKGHRPSEACFLQPSGYLSSHCGWRRKTRELAPSMWSWRSRILALKPVLCDPLVTSPVAAAPGRGSESTRLPWNRRLVPVSHKNRVPTRLDRWVLSRSPDKDRCSTTRLCTTLN